MSILQSRRMIKVIFYIFLFLIRFAAAIQLKNASEYKRAIEVYLKVAAMNESRRSYFNAGKALDSASGCCRDLEDLDGVLAYADQGLLAFYIQVKKSSFF